MKCPHCSTAMKVEWNETLAYIEPDTSPQVGTTVAFDFCPECEKLIVMLRKGIVDGASGYEYISDFQSGEIIFPRFNSRTVEPEVPEPYKSEYIEASSVINISSKASAALSRRILQNIIRQEFGIQHRSLAQEIDDFINQPSVPSHLTGAIDAIRNIGNFAAHPLKDTNTGEIIDVEPGEAEWLLDVLEALFDFTFVQPRRLDERKKKLNKKLKEMGKPPMKE